ncbi:Ephrin-B2a, partial [Larimichthys crocea]
MKIIMKVGQNPSDPSPPKDKPTKLPFPPKNDGKESYNPNEVLEKPGVAPRESENENGGKSSSTIGSE